MTSHPEPEKPADLTPEEMVKEAMRQLGYADRGNGEMTREMILHRLVRRAQAEEAGRGNVLAAAVVEMCKARGWSLHWTHRGAYLHLEASELIEAVRGKRGTVKGEAADVLLVLMSITENAGEPWSRVVEEAYRKLAEVRARSLGYPGEETSLRAAQARDKERGR